jgi:sulfonate transport system substrate-binding protein
MSAMMGGSVDCALLAGAAAYNTQAGGAHLVTNGEGLVEASICCAATKEFCDANPELVESFLKAQEQVLSFMADNEETALAEAAEFLDLDIAAVRDMYAYYDFDMTIRDSDIAAMQSTVQFMLDSGMIEESVDISSIVRR